MKEEFIQFPKELLERAIKVLQNHWFSDDGEYNNDDIIDLQHDLRELLKEDQNN